MQSPPSAHAYGNLTRAVIHTHCMHRCESLLKEKEKVSAKAAQLRARLSTQTQRANKAERALTNMNPEFQRLRGMKKHLSSELQMFVGCHTANRHVCMHHAYTTHHVCTRITHTRTAHMHAHTIRSRITTTMYTRTPCIISMHHAYVTHRAHIHVYVHTRHALPHHFVHAHTSCTYTMHR